MILLNDTLPVEYRVPSKTEEAFPVVFSIEGGETFRIFNEESLMELKEAIEILMAKIQKVKEENAVSII